MKKNSIVIEDIDVFDDLIWMSYRYCIGRKTIAAHMHANNLVKYIDKLPKKRRDMIARDIRERINDQIRWSHNIYDDGFANECDALTLIYSYLSKHPEIEDDTNYKFHVNTDTRETYVDPYEKKEGSYVESVYNMYTDMDVWIRLADYLDDKKHVTIKVKDDNEIKTYKAFLTPIIWQKEINFVYIDVDSYRKNPSQICYIDPDKIIEVK